MQFTKRMWITMLAAVLLVAGGLSYFAVAADVEPYYAVIAQCRVSGCDATAEEYIVETYYLWDSHRVGNRDCHYDYKAYVCVTECERGHKSDTYERRLTKNHEFCGAADQY